MPKFYNVAIISPVPFFYHIPLYRAIYKNGIINLVVMYCSDHTLKHSNPKKEYGPKNAIFHNDDLMEGYHALFLKDYFHLWREIKHGKYNMVILQSWSGPIWLLAFLACKWYVTPVFFMSDSNVVAEYQKPIYKKFLKNILLKRFFFKGARGFLASGTQNEKFYTYYGVPAQKIIRFPYSWGYENVIKKAEKLKTKREEIRKFLGIKKEDFAVLYVGRLSKEKNVIALLKSYHAVNNKNKTLYIVGGGPLKSSIEQYIKKSNVEKVRMVGFRTRDGVFDFYAATDVLVLPSEFEPWGMVVNEAMCFGMPVIVSSNVGAADDLVKNGYNGYVFSSGNINQLSLCLESIADMGVDTRRMFGARSLKIINLWIDSMNPVIQLVNSLK